MQPPRSIHPAVNLKHATCADIKCVCVCVDICSVFMLIRRARIERTHTRRLRNGCTHVAQRRHLAHTRAQNRECKAHTHFLLSSSSNTSQQSGRSDHTSRGWCDLCGYDGVLDAVICAGVNVFMRRWYAYVTARIQSMKWHPVLCVPQIPASVRSTSFLCRPTKCSYSNFAFICNNLCAH